MRRRAPLRASSASTDRLIEIIGSKLRRFGVALVCAKVFLVPLVFDQGADFPFPVPKTFFSHGLAFVLAGVLAGLLLQFGWSFVVRSWLHLPVLAFFAANGLATLFAADRVLALYGTHARMLGLSTIADWIVLYFAVVHLIRTRAEAIAVIASALGAALLVLVYELIQVSGRDPLSWSVDVTARPFSTFGQPTSLAQYLSVLALGSAALAAITDQLDWRARLAALLVFIGLLAGVLATGTRSGILGVVAGGALLVLLIWIKHPSRRVRTISLIGGASTGITLAVLVVLSPLGGRLATTLESALASGADEDFQSRLEPSASGRVALYAIAANMVRERPLLGYGPDNFPVGVARYRSEHEPREIQQSLATSAHSWVAYIATGSGLIGLGFFLAAIVIALALVVRSTYHPMAVAAGAMLAGFLGTGLTTVSDVATDWLLWANMAAIAATTANIPITTVGNAERSRRKPSRLSKGSMPLHARAAGPFFVAVGLLLALAGASAFDASRSTRQTHDSRLVGNIPRAIESGQRATRADGGRADYWHALGLAYAGAGRWAEASAAFERANRLAPYDVRFIGDLARAQLLLARSGVPGASARSIELGENAVHVDPNNPQAQLTRAVVMQVTGNLPEALRSAERALALDPQSLNDTLWVTATQIEIDSGHLAEAVRIARQGLAVFGATRRTVPLRIELARALATMGKPAEALSELDAALSIQPNDPSVENLKAQILAGMQR